jgi:hypothetical protein
MSLRAAALVLGGEAISKQSRQEQIRPLAKVHFATEVTEKKEF